MSRLITARGGGGIRSSSLTTVPFLDGNGDPPGDVKAIKDYLSRELKIGLHKKQQDSLVLAMTKPGDWLQTRDAELERITNEVSKTYADALSEAYKMHKFSAEDAQAYATRHTQAALDLKMEALEITNPGASTIFKGAAFAEASRDTQFRLLNGEGEFDREAYKRLRAQKKSLKGRK